MWPCEHWNQVPRYPRSEQQSFCSHPVNISCSPTRQLRPFFSFGASPEMPLDSPKISDWVIFMAMAFSTYQPIIHVPCIKMDWGGWWTSSYTSYKLIAWVPGWNDPQPFHDLPRECTNNSELQRFWQSDHGHNPSCFDGTLPSVSSNYQICILVDEIWWYIPPVVGLTV